MNASGQTLLPQAFFLATGAGQRFCLFYPAPTSLDRDPLLFLHPFAEELNTTRRVVAQAARVFARAGHPVLQIDLAGCGDSEGEFENATWDGWCNDARAAAAWLRKHTGRRPWLWGLRAGALLACELAQQNPDPAQLLFWQPVASGSQVLQQFLRLAAAGQWIDEAQRDTNRTPADALAQGMPAHVAGYTLSPALAQGLSEARLVPPPGRPPGRMIWMENSLKTQSDLRPATALQLGSWRAAGWQVHAQTFSGAAFWQRVGLDDAPALIHETLSALSLPHVAPSA